MSSRFHCFYFCYLACSAFQRTDVLDSSLRNYAIIITFLWNDVKFSDFRAKNGLKNGSIIDNLAITMNWQSSVCRRSCNSSNWKVLVKWAWLSIFLIRSDSYGKWFANCRCRLYGGRWTGAWKPPSILPWPVSFAVWHKSKVFCKTKSILEYLLTGSCLELDSDDFNIVNDYWSTISIFSWC